MRKSLKRWPVLLALVVVLGGLAVATFLPNPGSRVTRENCERIKEGMTEAEVWAILGKPWNDSLLDPDQPSKSDVEEVKSLWAERESSKARGPVYVCSWFSSNLGLYVYFDRDHQAVNTEFYSYRDRPRSWLPARVWRRLRARLGW
jgi:hypothetical protein